jgi:hypothetical protein
VDKTAWGGSSVPERETVPGLQADAPLLEGPDEVHLARDNIVTVGTIRWPMGHSFEIGRKPTIEGRAAAVRAACTAHLTI